MSEITNKYGELPKPANKTSDTQLTPEQLNIELAKFTAHQEKTLSQLNNTEQSLCAQLMLVNTVLITATIVVLGSIVQSSSFSVWDKLLVVIAFILLVVSTFSGIRYYFDIMELYKKWADVKHSITFFIANGYYTHHKQMSEDIANRQGKIKNDTDKKYLRIQIRYMAAAFAVYVLLIILVLFFGVNTEGSRQPEVHQDRYNNVLLRLDHSGNPTTY